MNAKRQDPGRDPRSAQYAADYAAGVKAAEADLQYFNEVAEATVLAALLRGMPQVDDLDPNLFHRAANQVIADRIIYLRATSGDQPEEDGLVVGVARLYDDLVECGKLEAANGHYYVSTLYEMPRPMSREVDFALKVVERNFYRRRAEEMRGKLATATAQWKEPEELARLLAECRYWEELSAGLGAEVRPTHFKFLTVPDLDGMVASAGLVGDVLYEDSIAFLYGPSGRWKSFIALDWALCVAAGITWWGKTCQRRRVVYVAAEGAAGIRKRIRAWRMRHRDADLSLFQLVPQPVNLMDGDQVRAFRDDISARGEAPGLVIFDTLARSMAGGDENATKDANIVTDHLGLLKASFGCCVLSVHHTGKDTGRGMRGNSAIFNNADTVILVNGKEGQERVEPGETVKLVSEKPKENEPFADIVLTTEKVSWSLDEYGDLIESSLVITMPGSSYSTGKPQPVKLAPSSLTALTAISSAQSGMRATEWWHVSGLKKTTFMQHAKPELVGRGYVVELDGVFRITTDGQAILAGEATSRVVPFRPA